MATQGAPFSRQPRSCSRRERNTDWKSQAQPRDFQPSRDQHAGNDPAVSDFGQGTRSSPHPFYVGRLGRRRPNFRPRWRMAPCGRLYIGGLRTSASAELDTTVFAPTKPSSQDHRAADLQTPTRRATSRLISGAPRQGSGIPAPARSIPVRAFQSRGGSVTQSARCVSTVDQPRFITGQSESRSHAPLNHAAHRAADSETPFGSR
jgi:hypothetical protein